MAFSSTDTVLVSLQTQIAACAGWAGGTGVVHYPDLAFASATFPCCVVAETNQSGDYYASGAAGLRGGSLSIVIYTQSSVTVTEALGRTILQELLAQQSGIPFRGGSVGLCGEDSDASTAAGTQLVAVEITLEYGLEN
jgi:hypothetical protein